MRHFGHERFVSGPPTQTFSRTVVNKANGVSQFLIRDLCKVMSFGEEFPQKTIDVFVRASLPGGVRIREVDFQIVNVFQSGITGKLFPTSVVAL